MQICAERQRQGRAHAKIACFEKKRQKTIADYKKKHESKKRVMYDGRCPHFRPRPGQNPACSDIGDARWSFGSHGAMPKSSAFTDMTSDTCSRVTSNAINPTVGSERQGAVVLKAAALRRSSISSFSIAGHVTAEQLPTLTVVLSYPSSTTITSRRALARAKRTISIVQEAGLCVTRCCPRFTSDLLEIHFLYATCSAEPRLTR